MLSGKKKTPPFWSFEYYQQFFDVDTSQVGRRLLGSFVPQFGQTYLDSHLRPSPDLYGPFWVCITLVFTLVISADLSLYSQESYADAHHNTHFSWINRAALMVFLYTWLVPVILYAQLYWRGVPTGQTFIEMVCLYGYSLTLFVPASLLCIIGNDYIRGIIVLVTCGLAGYVLLTSLWKGLEKDNNKIGLITLVCLALLHIAFAFAFLMFYISFADVDTPAATKPSPNDSKVPAVLKL
ncbi:hypothetical protein BSL78_13272 [Apostichopus japonicus]|uniref:Protein YIPF n=1 Tax=Stichopus japonicus TaxID=307972 RepID=A0A2G8KPH6_STIJA|nr:hypothetical protein BSL78_13272 [Apostichopus japonicus]